MSDTKVIVLTDIDTDGYRTVANIADADRSKLRVWGSVAREIDAVSIPAISPLEMAMESWEWPQQIKDAIITPRLPTIGEVYSKYSIHQFTHPPKNKGRYRFGQAFVNEIGVLHDPTLFYMVEDSAALTHIFKHYYNEGTGQ